MGYQTVGNDDTLKVLRPFKRKAYSLGSTMKGKKRLWCVKCRGEAGSMEQESSSFRCVISFLSRLSAWLEIP